eukprot:TRINITY_DN45299_c0_g1_i1.p1 TRINITY_DN45299_c0_g1~~TRINITY_DN45299_c0_g1_i1.p1  ORF type:complete len:109 (-),score=5.19 TRINITY_DN45299_c0_g1_i1:102-428(-)
MCVPQDLPMQKGLVSLLHTVNIDVSEGRSRQCFTHISNIASRPGLLQRPKGDVDLDLQRVSQSWDSSQKKWTLYRFCHLAYGSGTMIDFRKILRTNTRDGEIFVLHYG